MTDQISQVNPEGSIQALYVANELERMFPKVVEEVAYRKGAKTGAHFIVTVAKNTPDNWYHGKITKPGVQKLDRIKHFFSRLMKPEKLQFDIPADNLPHNMRTPLMFFRIVEEEIKVPIVNADYGRYYWFSPLAKAGERTSEIKPLSPEPFAELLGVYEGALMGTGISVGIPTQLVNTFLVKRSELWKPSSPRDEPNGM